MDINFLKNENISVNEKIRKIEESKKNNFSEFETMTSSEINKIKKEIEKVYKKAQQEKISMEGSIDNMESQIKDNANILDLDDATVEDIINKQRESEEIKKEKSKLKKEIEDINLSLNNKNATIIKISDLAVLRQRKIHAEAIEKGNENLSNLETEITSLQAAIKDYDKEEELLNESINSLKEKAKEVMLITSDPLEKEELDKFEELVNNLKEKREKLQEVQEKKVKAENELEEKQNQKNDIQDDLKLETKLQEKQDKKDDKINEYGNELLKLSQKEKLSKLELSEAKALFDVIDRSDLLTSEEKEPFKDLYITIAQKNQVEIDIKEPTIKPNKKEKISKRSSIVAKGKIKIIKSLSEKIEQHRIKKNAKKQEKLEEKLTKLEEKNNAYNEKMEERQKLREEKQEKIKKQLEELYQERDILNPKEENDELTMGA